MKLRTKFDMTKNFNTLHKEKIKNVFIFVSDSLRFDFCPQEVMDMGLTIKTIASSLYTCPSFPSIVSGLYPQKHGVHKWQDVLSDSKLGLLSISGYNISLWCETTWTHLPPNNSQIHAILRNPKGIPLEEIDPPFIFIEDDKGGHCPYGLPFSEYMDGGCLDFFKEYGMKGKRELIKQYKIGIENSVQRFKNRLKTLRQRNLVDNTLVIFTSDHGEILGEYGGLIGHGRPPCPELVYIPTIFIHPSIKPTMIDSGVLRHVDIYPTICRILNIPIPTNLDGVDFFNAIELPEIGINYRKGGYFESKNRIKKMFNYGAISVWDYNGGHVFHSLGFLRSIIFFFYKICLTSNPEFYFMKEGLKKENIWRKIFEQLCALKHLAFPYLRYGAPKIGKKVAKEIIENCFRNLAISSREGQAIDEEVRKRLETLGYID